MIRRILHAELSDVRALASEAKRCAVNAFHRNFFLALDRADGCVVIGRGRSEVGAGYVVGHAGAADWPDGARLLTIGRVTLAAWGGRPS
jgi:hypothetical protein